MILKYDLYNGEVVLEFENGNKHIYRVDGEIIPGVTTVVNVLDKPALKQWAANEAIEYCKREIRPGQRYDEIDLGEIFENARFAFRKKADKSATIGTMVHDLIEKWIKKLPFEEPINEQVRNGFNSFRQWAQENKVEFLVSEAKIYSKKLKYAGTLDFIAKINNKLYMGDIKTSSGIYDEMWYQVSAYQQARIEEYGEDFAGQVIVNCRKDGELEVRYSNNFIKDIGVFVACLEIYNRQQEIKNEEKRQAGSAKRTYASTAQAV